MLLCALYGTGFKGASQEFCDASLNTTGLRRAGSSRQIKLPDKVRPPSYLSDSKSRVGRAIFAASGCPAHSHPVGRLSIQSGSAMFLIIWSDTNAGQHVTKSLDHPLPHVTPVAPSSKKVFLINLEFDADVSFSRKTTAQVGG